MQRHLRRPRSRSDQFTGTDAHIPITGYNTTTESTHVNFDEWIHRSVYEHPDAPDAVPPPLANPVQITCAVPDDSEPVEKEQTRGLT